MITKTTSTMGAIWNPIVPSSSAVKDFIADY